MDGREDVQRIGAKRALRPRKGIVVMAHSPVGEALEAPSRSARDIEAFFVRMIKKAKANGDIPPHVKPAETASGLLASLLGLAVLTRSRPERTLLQAIVEDAMRRLA